MFNSGGGFTIIFFLIKVDFNRIIPATDSPASYSKHAPTFRIKKEFF